MFIKDFFTAKSIAFVYTESASNKIEYLGKGFFSPKKKMGLDLSWIKGHKGIPVTLKASAFDTVSTIRTREGVEKTETLMAYFKESMIVKEQDEQEILRLLDSNDPYAPTVIARVYNDANTLIEGAEVIPERMIWQLLAPANNGKPAINIAFDNATYDYDYDPNGEWASNNYVALTGNDAWTNDTNSDPVADVSDLITKIQDETGTTPKYLVVNTATMGYLKKNKNIKAMVLAQNVTANVIMNNARVKELFESELGVTILVYDKQFKNESGVATKFLPNGYAVLLPEGELGNMWYGTTPAERAKLADPTKNIELVDGRIAVQVTITDDPVQTKTTVSEICLPSYERMDEVGVIKAY